MKTNALIDLITSVDNEHLEVISQLLTLVHEKDNEEDYLEDGEVRYFESEIEPVKAWQVINTDDPGDLRNYGLIVYAWSEHGTSYEQDTGENFRQSMLDQHEDGDPVADEIIVAFGWE